MKRYLYVAVAVCCAAGCSRAQDRSGKRAALATSVAAPKAEGETMPNEKKFSNEELRKILNPTQFRVTRENGTEAPFQNEYWNNHEEGIYVDVVSGKPLFSSKDKYDSGTGWPSFTRPLDSSGIVVREDSSHGMARSEVRSKDSDSHLGHVFDDGPGPTGERFCMNSASLRFIPVSKLQAEGYGEYLKLFESSPREPGTKKSGKPRNP